jgi:hypothetical protein
MAGFFSAAAMDISIQFLGTTGQLKAGSGFGDNPARRLEIQFCPLKTRLAYFS